MQQHQHSFEKEIQKRVALRYLLWLPDGYDDAERPWPLIMFLHGRGERGDDVTDVARQGLPRRLADGLTLPAIVAAPQCPELSDWTLHDDDVLALVDELSATYTVDPDRVYLTGLSMGGRGAWRLAATHPERWAALATICGRRPDAVRRLPDAQPLVGMPIWVFHGAKDDVVPISESQELVDALREYGAEIRFTVYPDAGHDSWTAAYADPQLYEWLFAQKRSAKARE